jgi:hypothetical protein
MSRNTARGVSGARRDWQAYHVTPAASAAAATTAPLQNLILMLVSRY